MQPLPRVVGGRSRGRYTEIVAWKEKDLDTVGSNIVFAGIVGLLIQNY